MKKFYVKPSIDAYALSTLTPCAQSRSLTLGGEGGGQKFSNGDDGFFSKEFVGGIEDDTQGGGLWDEEN
ncbi:MAG: hypothetical protein J5678_03755 [Bacteroidaceae bacterium]|nr:hypothetical protein [Bacteroidaceae bacterium]